MDPVRGPDYYLFLVVTREGKPKLRNGKLMVYAKQKWAERAARGEGDSVIAVDVDLGREPVFIRGVRL